MKAALLASMAVAATCFISPADAQCSNQTIQGDYAFTVQGNVLSPEGTVVQLVNAVGIVTNDGAGNFTQEDFQIYNGVPLSGGPTNPSGFHTGETGTYSINPDCSGSATLVLGPGSVLNLALVVAKNGATYHNVVSSGTIDGVPVLLQTRADAERITSRRKVADD